MFRHILNFLRTNSLNIPEPFDEIDQLYEEAKYYDIHELIRCVFPFICLATYLIKHTFSIYFFPRLLEERMEFNGDGTTSRQITGRVTSSQAKYKNGHSLKSLLNQNRSDDETYQILALNISPELGERIMISGERALIEEIFPEISSNLMDARSGLAWNRDSKHVIRFPLNGYCKLISLQAMSRIMNNNFKMVASTGGGADGQQFSEYIFIRKSHPC